MTKLNTTLLKDLPIKQTSITDNDYVVVSSGGTKKLKIKDITKDVEKKAANLEEKTTELSEQLEHKANKNEIVLKGSGNLNDFDEETRALIQGLSPGEINAVLGVKNVKTINISDKSVMPNNTSFLDVTKTVNLFNSNYVTDRGYVLNSKGVLSENIDGCVSEYLYIKGMEKLNTGITWTGAFYDENKSFISQKAFGIQVVDVPVNAWYYRQSCNITTIDKLMIVEGDTLPSKYIPPFTYSLNDVLRNDVNEGIINCKFSSNETTFFTENSVNKFNKDESIDGYIINGDGELTAKSDGCTGYFIRVKPNTVYTINSTWTGAFYNASKKFISVKSFGITTFTTPSDCYFISLGLPLSQKNSYMLIEGNELPEIYVPYEYNLCFANENQAKSVATQLSKFINNHNMFGVKWAVIGDSLTEKNSRALKNYHDYVAEDTGVTVLNYGKGGTGYMKTQENNTAFYQRVMSISNDFDIITIFGSGNDLSLISKLGNPTDTGTTTICGCVNTTIDEIYKIKPGARIGIISPCPWGSNNPATPNVQMGRYADALESICKLRGIPYLDLFRSSNMRPWDSTFKSLYYKRDDGNSVHPDEDGHKLMYKRFLSFIQSL